MAMCRSQGRSCFFKVKRQFFQGGILVLHYHGGVSVEVW